MRSAGNSARMNMRSAWITARIGSANVSVGRSMRSASTSVERRSSIITRNVSASVKRRQLMIMRNADSSANSGLNMGFEFKCGTGFGEFVMGRVRSSPEATPMIC